MKCLCTIAFCVYACVFEACLNTFPSPEELLSHLIEGHRIGAENQSCPSCGEQFEDAKQLVQHWLPRRRGLPPRCIRRNPKHTQADDLHLALTRDRLRNGLSKHSRSLLSRIRLLALRKPNERFSVRAYRCPLCPRRCHALSRLRQHLESAHGDTLVSAVEEPIKSTHPNETDGSPPRSGLSTDCPTSHQSTTLSPVVGRCVPKSTSSKTVLFLLHIDEDKSAAGVRKSSATSSTFAARKRNRKSSSPLSCQHCGKTFQKLKFFTDHQQLCQQRIEERERRSRLQAHRRAGFKVSTDSASLSVDDGLCVSCPDVAPTLKLSSSEVSTEITGPNLRRSGRSKHFRPLWKPKSERSNPKRTLLNETFSINREMSNIPTSVIH
ncbi:hypothetical protein EG68_04790 [Paragonimus skrjabini miyazakii]|uniref:C2H2-type domain-containing protein n=1 Tax=Paragonimus skrjabini miyazakii TaxID=59628 RepID=A0A8S9Z5G0_9TREM|nr:hypothetical protein EG68_04790 [Paragonimus skrjabini miyazakii]